MMQVDIVEKLPECKGYKYILSAMDMFSKYLFAIPIKHPDDSTVAGHLTDLFFQHSYITRSILCHKGSVFTNNLIKELAQILETKIENASVKHAQTIGLLERAHGPLKKYLRIYENLNSRQWPKLATPAAHAYNNRYHASIGCTPSFIFHGREPFGTLELRFNTQNLQNKQTKYDFNIELHNKMQHVFQQQHKNLLSSYHKYREYYDRKTRA